MSWIAAAIGGSALLGYMGSQSQADAASGAARTSADATRYGIDINKQIYDQTRTDQAPWRLAGIGGLNKLAQGLGVPGMPLDATALRAQLLPQFTRSGSVPGSASGGAQSWNGPITDNPAMGVFPQQNAVSGQTIDEAGLQAAINNALAKQSTDQAATARSPDYGSLLRPFAMSDYQADPGYAFRRSEGLRGLEHSAAARGGLLSGGAMRGLDRYNSDLASNEFQNAYNRYGTNQTNQYNRLASMAGLGQTANTALGQAGQNYATGVTGLSQTNATNQGNAQLFAGQARASAYGGVGNSLMKYSMGGGFGGGGGGVDFSNPDYMAYLNAQY